MSVARVVRACTASLSSRTLSRPALVHNVHRCRRRYYSETSTGSTPKPTTTESETPEEPPTQEEQISPELEKLQAKEAEVLDLTSRLRYLQADFQNLQRNAAREKEQTRDFAVTRFAADLLETVDVLSLALNSIPKSFISPKQESSLADEASSPPPPPTTPTKTPEEHLRELYEGVELTQRQLLSTLFKYHVKPFNPTGDKFDPNKHEALFQTPATESVQPGTVSQCLKTGYMIKDRVLRAAQVGVSN